MDRREAGVKIPVPEPPMNITPLDITQKSFSRSFRGLDAEEVAAFLALVANEFEGLVK